MHPAGNGPPVLNGGNNNYDRAVCMDAPVDFDTGLYLPPSKTRAQLIDKLMVRLGYAAMLANKPPGMAEELGSFLEDAQEQLYTRYDTLRTERWWAWQLEPGKRFYDTPIDCTKVLNFRKITYAAIADHGGRALRSWTPSTAFSLGLFIMPPEDTGFEYQVTAAGTSGADEPVWPVVEGGTVVTGGVTLVARKKSIVAWLPMIQGINPLDYGSPAQGFPTHFELREYIEIWPAPQTSMVLWLKGHMGLKRFSEDTDTLTIDEHPVFLMALAMAKAHRGQPDAANYAQMVNRMLGDLVAGSHGTARYIPRPSTGGMKLGADDVLPALPRATWR